MATQDDQESCCSNEDIGVVQPSLTGAVSLTWVPTLKGDSPKNSSRVRVPERRARDSAKEEQEAIIEFLRSMPMIDKEFNIKYKIGEGTFSSVYLASLKEVPEEKVAIKHLIPISSSKRIENEIFCLQLIGGCEHIMSLLSTVRHKDHIALIMPYFKHDRFQDYFQVMSLREAKDYMRALLVALRTVHSHQIVHRDVKPSNFLYNRANRQFQLVDFGLAHKVHATDVSKSHKPVAKSRPKSSSKGEVSLPSISKLNGIAAPTYSKQLAQRGAPRLQRHSAKSRNTTTKERIIKTSRECEIKLCPLRHKLSEVCDVCMSRSNQAVPRAGTPGFRAPEVLLKYPGQTTAIDIWSAGVILLCLLSGRYPFFKAHNDLSALAQIISLLGSEECARAASEYGKDLVCVPEVKPTDLKSLCTALRRSLPEHKDHQEPPAKRTKQDTTKENSKPQTRTSPSLRLNSSDDSWTETPDDAFDLLYRLLDFNPLSRITAAQALEHSFVTNPT